MKERPILFSAPMVRALLAGTKTQTRRAFKPRGWKSEAAGALDFVHVLHGEAARVLTCAQPADTAMAGFRLSPGSTSPGYFKCPYGQPGDRLWVREAWKAHTTFDHLPPREIPQSHVWYMADDGYKAQSRTRVSIHMPRWASRILLEITEVRVERLQGVSEGDARAEGCAPAWLDADDGRTVHAHRQPTYRQGYARLWREINGDASWGANPWVWAVSFRQLEATGP